MIIYDDFYRLKKSITVHMLLSHLLFSLCVTWTWAQIRQKHHWIYMSYMHNGNSLDTFGAVVIYKHESWPSYEYFTPISHYKEHYLPPCIFIVQRPFSHLSQPSKESVNRWMHGCTHAVHLYAKQGIIDSRACQRSFCCCVFCLCIYYEPFFQTEQTVWRSLDF